MKKFSKLLCMILTLVMIVSVFSACSPDSTAGEDTTFTWWIYSGADSSYYMDYQENPAIQYTLQKGYGPEEKQLAFEFWVPAAGTSADNYSTMIAGGDLADIIDAVICDPPKTMYEQGLILDITEYVERNMPNYVALVHSNETFYKNCVDVIDGKEHYFVLRGLQDAPEAVFQGFMYRRDWLVKYGTNPETGKAFTGGYTDPADPDSWKDDVVFPSGGADPIYISDWEWMFEIFAKAQKELGIDDSYVLSLYYPVFLSVRLALQMNMAAVQLLPFLLSKPSQVMFLHTSPLTLFQLLTDRFSLKQSFSIQVLCLLSTPVFLLAVLVVLLS